MGPIHGIKVLDFSQAAFGPVCARLLGDLGADVIKVEPLEGDMSRLTALREGDSVTFLNNNRSKRSLAINLQTPKGKEIIWKLLRETDVVIQNFRPGVMKKMGLDYEKVRQVNPKVIYGSFYMYGEEGPLAHRRGGDPWGQAFTGVVASQGSPEGPPYMAGHAFLDWGGAALNAFTIVTALLMRERTGIGQEVTNNLVNTGCYLQETAISHYLFDGLLLKKGGRGGARGTFPYGAYPAKDGDVVTIFGQDDYEWPIFCSILGIEHLLGDERYDTVDKRAQHRFELYPILDEAFRQKTRAEWQELFRQQGLRCDPCLDYAELVAHPQFEANERVVEVEHPRDGTLRMLNVPMKFKAVGKLESFRHAPILGEHSREVCQELGYPEEEVEALVQDGVLGVPTPDMLEPGDRKKLAYHNTTGRGTLRRREELKAQRASPTPTSGQP